MLNFFIPQQQAVKRDISHSDHWWELEYATVGEKGKVLKPYDLKYSDPKRPTGNLPITEAFFDAYVLPKIGINPAWRYNVFIAHNHTPNIVVVESPELVSHLVHRAGVALERILFVGFQQWKCDAVLEYNRGMKKNQVIHIKGGLHKVSQFLTESQYDAAIMNPDWELTSEFVDIARTIVKSTGTIVVIHDAKYANDHNWNQVAEFEFTGNSFNNVQLTSAVSVLKLQDVSETLLKDSAGNMMAVLPETIKVGPADDLKSWHIANTILGLNLKGYESITGSLDRQDMKLSVASDAIEVVQTVGRKNDPLNIVKVDSSLQAQIAGVDEIMVVLGVDYEPGNLGPLKVKPKGVGIGNRVRGISAKSMADAKRIIDHLQSPEVKVLVSVLKGYTAKNGVKLFRQIPTHNEKSDWKANCV
jgi:hypothetical protein